MVESIFGILSNVPLMLVLFRMYMYTYCPDNRGVLNSEVVLYHNCDAKSVHIREVSLFQCFHCTCLHVHTCTVALSCTCTFIYTI